MPIGARSTGGDADPPLAAMLLLEAPGAAGVRHPLPADLAGGDGQGRRGHRVLPLRPAAGAQRGRRRPGAVRARRRAVPRRATPERAARFPREPADHADPRHQAQRRRPRPDRRAGGDARGLARARATLARRSTRRCASAARPTPSRSTSSTRRWSARGRSTPSGSRPTSEGAARGQAQHELGATRPGVGGEASSASATRCSSTTRSSTDFEPFAASGGGDRSSGRARAAPAEAHRSRRSRHLPGRRAAIPGAGRSRQPPAGRLGGAGCTALAERGPDAAPDPRDREAAR